MLRVDGSHDVPFNSTNRLITGGEGDLAQVLKDHFESAGYRVFAPGRSDLDVCDKESIREYFETIAELNLLINNAGIARDASIFNLKEPDWDSVVATNLKGAFLTSRAAAKAMIRSKQSAAHILHVGSFSALSGTLGQSNYAAAKAGLIGLSASLAQEFGRRGLRSIASFRGS